MISLDCQLIVVTVNSEFSDANSRMLRDAISSLPKMKPSTLS